MERMNLKEKLIRYIIVIFFAVIWIIPLYMAVITPFKSIKEIFRTVLALPQAWKLDSFLKVFQEVDIWHYLKNSFVITGGSVVILGISVLWIPEINSVRNHRIFLHRRMLGVEDLYENDPAAQYICVRHGGHLQCRKYLEGFHVPAADDTYCYAEAVYCGGGERTILFKNFAVAGKYDISDV